MKNDIICFKKKQLEDKIKVLQKLILSAKDERHINHTYIGGMQATIHYLESLLSIGFSGEEIFNAGEISGNKPFSGSLYSDSRKFKNYEDYLKSKENG